MIVPVEQVRHLFAGEQVDFVLAAMIAGHTPARAWTDDAGRTALIWDCAHTVYFAGAVDQPAEWGALFREIASVGFLKLYVSDAAAGTVFAGCPLQRRERVLYRGSGNSGPQPTLPDGFTVSAICDPGLELANGAEVVAEIESCWESLDAFRRNGFGFIAHDGRTIVGWCTAECVSDTRCGVGIETVPEFHGRGFATATGVAFAEYCAGRGMTPYWDAWSDNMPSIAVAEKAGFRRVTPYSIFVLPG